MLELVVKYRRSDELVGCVEYIRVLLVDSISRWHSAYRTRRDPDLPPPRVHITSLHITPVCYFYGKSSPLLVNYCSFINPQVLYICFSVLWFLLTIRDTCLCPILDASFLRTRVLWILHLFCFCYYRNPALLLQVFKEERLDRMQIIRLINLVADAGWLPQPLASTVEIIEIIDLK